MTEHYLNMRYNPMYAAQSTYLHRAAYIMPTGYKTTPKQAENALLAPLCDSMVSEIDFKPPYLNKDMDPITGLFDGKALFGKTRIQSFLHDMDHRYKLMNDNIRTLDYKICEIDSMIEQLAPHGFGLSKDMDRTRTSLESEVISLEAQKMREKTTAWKDVNRIKSDLLDGLQEYSSAQNSGSFLNNNQGDENH
ncbi:hypothetical protein BVX94_02240 [bacterium B17]|nr:hypothetical protein BVX94_02240 [bacterium B17]